MTSRYIVWRTYGENMPQPAVAVLESALRDRKLDRTLTTALPPLERTDPIGAGAPADVAALDACLRGGLPARPAVGARRATLVGAHDAAAAAHGGGHRARRDRRARRHLRSAGRGVGRRRRCRSRSRALDPWSGRRARWPLPQSTVARSSARSRRSTSCCRPAASAWWRSIWPTCRGRAAAHPVHDVAARAARDRRQRHGVRARHARAAGAQRRRAHAVARRPRHVGGEAPIAAVVSRRRLTVRVVSPRRRVEATCRLARQWPTDSHAITSLRSRGARARLGHLFGLATYQRMRHRADMPGVIPSDGARSRERVPPQRRAIAIPLFVRRSVRGRGHVARRARRGGARVLAAYRGVRAARDRARSERPRAAVRRRPDDCRGTAAHRRRRGLRVRVAIAGTRTAARLLVRHRAGLTVVEPG